MEVAGVLYRVTDYDSFHLSYVCSFSSFYVEFSAARMEKLASLGVRVDSSERLRIIAEESAKDSTEISQKSKLILRGLYS